MNLVVYTAVFGASDHLRDLRHGTGVCFTDQKQLRAEGWEQAGGWELRDRLCDHDQHPRVVSRWYKMHPHLLFPSADATLWIDASFQVRADLSKALAPYAEHCDVRAFAHPTRTSIRDEADAIARIHHVPLETLWRQVEHYWAAGFKLETLSAMGFLLRRNNDAARRFNERWWEEYCHWGHDRDQMSADYAAWATPGLRFRHFESVSFARNPWVRYRKVPQQVTS